MGINFNGDSQVETSESQKKTRIALNDAVEFSQYIEEVALKEHRTALSVLVEYIEENGIPDDKIKALLSRSLLETLRKNYEDLGLLTPDKNSLKGIF